MDWGGGSLPLYSQAAANTRVVGLEVAFFINKLIVSMYCTVYFVFYFVLYFVLHLVLQFKYFNLLTFLLNIREMRISICGWILTKIT